MHLIGINQVFDCQTMLDWAGVLAVQRFKFFGRQTQDT